MYQIKKDQTARPLVYSTIMEFLDANCFTMDKEEQELIAKTISNGGAYVMKFETYGTSLVEIIVTE